MKKIMILFLSLLLVHISIGQNYQIVKTSVDSNDITQSFNQSPDESGLIKGLSNQSQTIRDSCAIEIRRILAQKRNVIKPGNILL